MNPFKKKRKPKTAIVKHTMADNIKARGKRMLKFQYGLGGLSTPTFSEQATIVQPQAGPDVERMG
jgi:hypothetical protein